MGSDSRQSLRMQGSPWVLILCLRLSNSGTSAPGRLPAGRRWSMAEKREPASGPRPSAAAPPSEPVPSDDDCATRVCGGILPVRSCRTCARACTDVFRVTCNKMEAVSLLQFAQCPTNAESAALNSANHPQACILLTGNTLACHIT